MIRLTIVFCCVLGTLLGHSQISFAAPNLARIDGSESIPPSVNYAYQLQNMTDENLMTAWCTRAHRVGKAWIELYAHNPGMWAGFGLINGYARNEQTFKRNSRVKKIGVYADEKYVGEFVVADTKNPQWFALPSIRASSLTLKVEGTYKGDRDDDLCITELILDDKVIGAWNKLDEIAKHTGNRSLSALEIKKFYQPLLKGIYANQPDQGTFSSALALYTYGQKEVELRMLLDLIYQANQGDVLYAEFVEGLSGLIVSYFKYNPKAVLNVWSDKGQLMHHEIANAYLSFIDPFGEGELEKYKQDHQDFRKLSILIEEEPGQ